MKRAFWVVVLGGATAISLFTSGCRTVPETGRRQLNLVSGEQELQLGLTAFDQLKKETPISRDTAKAGMVSRVGTRIAAQAGQDLPNAQWEFVLFASPEANAFCLPGGKVGVFEGLMPIAQNEAGLATVVGHEVAHASAHHGSERMSQQMVVQGIGQLGGAAISNPQVQQIAMLAYGAGTKVGLELPHSRKQESEADRIGLMYMARAGYDPAEAIEFWKRFATSHEGQSAGPAFLRTHPLDSKRIADLEALLPEARAAYQQAKGAGATPETPSGRGRATPGGVPGSRTTREPGSTIISR
jgi:metalloendopeptidase OMA1, mitochondrial